MAKSLKEIFWSEKKSVFEAKMIHMDRGEFETVVETTIKVFKMAFEDFPHHEGETLEDLTKRGLQFHELEVFLDDVFGNERRTLIILTPEESIEGDYRAIVSGVVKPDKDVIAGKSGEIDLHLFINSTLQVGYLKGQFEKELRYILGHELIHAHDHLGLSNKTPANFEKDLKVYKKYINSPQEVRAFARTFYEQIRDDALDKILSGESPHDALQQELRSKTGPYSWQHNKNFFTERNKKRVLSMMLNELIKEAGLN